jgi:hypothetical protein
MPLEEGRGVLLTPMSMSGGGEMLFCRLWGETSGAKGRSLLGVTGKEDIEWISLISE